MIWVVLASFVFHAATPSPAAEALGRQLAATGTLAALLPLISVKETDELIAAHPELDAAAKADLRTMAQARAAAGMEKILAAEGHAYAKALSINDLKILVAASRSGASRRLRAAMPRIVAGTMQSLSGVDFKGETLAAFCAKTGKACPAP